MGGFDRVREALVYIDEHLDQPIDFEQVSLRLHYSSYYFHRVFSAVVGKTITAHIRERRLLKACQLLARSDMSILDICLCCGFDSPQSFSRTFKAAYGVSPSTFRSEGYVPADISVDELIIRFTNRLKGGILVNPKIIKREGLLVAGVTGDGSKTAQIWEDFETLRQRVTLDGALSDNGYEIRFNTDGSDYCDCHAGHLVSSGAIDPAYTLVELPPSLYAAFDVYVAKGYNSEYNAMVEWLATNEQGYKERRLDGRCYCVEFYDERFRGEEADSIVEIWIPIEKG